MSGTQTPDGGDDLVLKVGGQIYGGWTAVRISRGIDRMATDFDIEVTERWAGQAQPWQLAPFLPCTVSLGGVLALTGYVDEYLPAIAARRHVVRVRGRSKTEDVIDCTPDLPSGQFSGNTLDTIARAIAQPFGVQVVVSADVGAAFPDATMQRHETGFAFLERLARLRRVLLTDDEQGRLVLASAGSARATDALIQGANILEASATISGAKRFSVYIVKGSAPVRSPPAVGVHGGSTWAGLGDGAAPQALAPIAQTPVAIGIEGRATDGGVPRYRPHAIVAESGLDAAGAQERADWESRHAAARGTVARIAVAGWRQSDGSLWRANTIASVNVPYLQLDRELLIARVTYLLDDRGRRTEMELGPVEGYTPDPGQVRVRKNRGGKKGGAVKGAGGDPWNGLGS